MICEECTHHIAQRHHAAIFFGLFFGIADYIFTQYAGNPEGNEGTLAMSRGSALSAMIWCTIIVYTIDRRWIRAAVACVVASGFAAIGIIHQAEAIGDDFRAGTGGNISSTSPFEFMMGYLSMAGVCIIYWALQTFFGKKTEPGDEGYEDDLGYLPPIEEAGVDDMFATWWDPVTVGKTSDETGVQEESSEDDLALKEEDLEKKEDLEEGEEITA